MAKGTEIWVCPQCGFRMDIAPLGLYAEVQCPRCFRVERVHAQLGNFRLDAVLGVGGMSVVYRAFDVVLHRALALKVLNDTFRDQPERIERFENESAMMARVRHDNVTSVYSAGRAYGQFYIAMELVEGINLEYMVTSGSPMAPERALDIIRQVACGLKSAHEAGLLHRDMKPGNVLITPEGRAKVIDFGLAMDSRQDDTEEIIWATPYYVPPETLQRNPEDVRTDIYALGMTLRYLLTGVESFDVEITSLQALVQCKRKLPPLAKQDETIPPGLAELADHMTAFAPVDRPKDYTELLEEIDEVQQELAGEKPQVVAKKKSRRSSAKLLVGGGVALLGALVGYMLAPDPGPGQHEFYSTPSSGMSARDEALDQAIQFIRNDDYRSAVVLLLESSLKEPDPCMGAWKAQLARVLLAARWDNAEAAILAQQYLLRHLANRDAARPMGRRAIGLMANMDTRPYPGMREWESGSSDWNSITKADVEKAIEELPAKEQPPVIKLIEWYVLAEKANWLGLSELNAQCMNALRGVDSLGEYQPLQAALSAAAAHKKSVGTVELRGFAEADMRERRFPLAIQKLTAISNNMQFSEEQRERALVLREVCEVGAGIFRVLARKAPNFNRDRVSNMSAEELVRMAKGLSPATREAVWASSSASGYSPAAALDGNPDTFWRPRPDPSSVFLVDLDYNEKISRIIFRWADDAYMKFDVRVFSGGKIYSQSLEKQHKTTIIDLGADGMYVDRIAFSSFESRGNTNVDLTSLSLVSPARKGEFTPNLRFGANDLADQLDFVLEMTGGNYDAAFRKMGFLASRQRVKSPFIIMLEDWKRRWYGEK